MYNLIMRAIIISGFVSVLIWGSAALNDLRSSEEALSDRIYVYIMDEILKGKLTRELGGDYIPGETHPYRKKKRSKALAACLSFGSHRVVGIVLHGSWYAYRYNAAGRARRAAKRNCQTTFEKEYGCECFIIDVNDSSYISRSGILDTIKED